MMSETQWLRNAWAEISDEGLGPRTQRITSPELLPQYCAVDGLGRFMFYVKTTQKPEQIEQLAHLAIFTKHTEEGWIRSYTLLSSDFFDEFLVLINSLIEASKDQPNEVVAMRAQRAAYEQWLAFYKKRQGFNLSSARGLFGELTVLKSEKRDRGMSWMAALEAWKGPNASPQDFIFSPDSAVEVKAVNLSAKRIKINGVEQLDFKGELRLLVLTVADSPDSSRGKNLRSVLDEIKQELTRGEKDMLEQRLELVGYDSEAEVSTDRYFEAVAVTDYLVDSDFPRVRSESLPQGIEGVEYQIKLSAIAKFAK